MKIAFFTPTLNVGGYEKVVLGFANHITEKTEHQVIIVCGNGDGALRNEISPRIKICCLKCKTRTLLPRLIAFMNQEKPDVIYTGFRIYNSIAILARALSKSRRTKIAISQHGYEYTNRFLKKCFSVILKKADLLIGVTESLRAFEVSDLNLTCKSVVVGNPVIHKNTPSAEAGHRAGKCPMIVTCGRLSEDKNYRLAIQIVKEITNRNIEVNMMVLGDGPEKHNLEDYAEQFGLKERIRFEGYVGDTIRYMRAGDIYLHTCDREGFGNTVVEAMFAGLPVVTTDCGGPVDLIEQDRYGRCFGNGRCSDAAVKGADAILDVLSHYERYSGLHDKAMQYEVTRVSKVLLEEFEAIV